MKIQDTFHELLSHHLLTERSEPTSTPNTHLNPLHTRERLTQQINKHHGLCAADHQAMRSKLDPAARTIAVPATSGLYHVRHPAYNQIPLFYCSYETELPELSSIKLLPEKDQAFYEVRYLAKRGRNMHTDLPVEDTKSGPETRKASPKLNAQSKGIRAIRSEAATATVDHYINPQQNHVARLHQHVIAQLDPQFLAAGGKIHLVRPTCHHYAGDATLNLLTFCTQTEMARTLNAIEQGAAKEAKRSPLEFTDYKSCITISRTARTESSPIGRLVQQGYFATDEIDAGDKVIILDDHVQAGGSILAMAAALKEAGADILGLCALTTHPYSTSLELRGDVKAHMHHILQQWDPEHLVLNELHNMGMPIDTLTSAEALILIAYATNPHDELAMQQFKTIEDSFTNNRPVMDGEHDSLTPILNQLPSSPKLIVEEMKNAEKTTRKTIEHTPVSRVEVLDWDCCITNEKTMNYQLMVNTLFVAAHEYQQKHPEIQALAQAVLPHIHGEKYQEGMPKLCMGSDRFTEFGIVNPQFWKKGILVDLIENIHTIAPNLHIANEKKQILVSILQREFKRQYKDFTRPPIPQEVQARRDALAQAKSIDVPFKNIQLEYMPGAEEFLKQHRKPNTRLILISNKGDHDVHNEVNKLGVAHYFDHIQGMGTVSKNEKVKTQFAKPNPTRLVHALEKLALKHRPLHIRFTGDQTQDITQAEVLLTEKNKSISGLLIAPKEPENLASVREKGIPVEFVPTFKHLEETLSDFQEKL